jgi:2',3'-cyclic-nucleotide 2'-phosphodiesterase (5'-nucleotidase family)
VRTKPVSKSGLAFLLLCWRSNDFTINLLEALMKQRLLVMNGQRIVQEEIEGAWANQKVDKAGALKPGIYNIYTADKADKSKRYDGVVVHTDNNNVYQQIDKKFVMHSRQDFDAVPIIGSAKSISYNEQGKAVVSAEAVKLSRGRSR